MTAIEQRNSDGAGIIWILIGGLILVKGMILLSLVTPDYYDNNSFCGTVMITGFGDDNGCSNSSIMMILSSSTFLVGFIIATTGVVKYINSQSFIH